MAASRQEIEKIVAKVMASLENVVELDDSGAGAPSDDMVPVNVSNRHIHLTEEDYKVLFGDMEFVNVKDLLQTGEFASNRAVDVEGPKATIKKVRVLGPYRSKTQVELAQTDARVIGVAAPVRMSGDIEDSAPITLVGPCGQLELRKGAIIAQRHIHMTPADAARFGVKDGDKVSVRVDGPRPTTYDNTVIRVRDDFVLEMHLDTDEANSLGPTKGQLYGQVKVNGK